MNKIINKFLLAADKFMAELHLRQPGFTYSNVNCLKGFENQISHIYKIELDKACFAHDAAYSDIKDLTKRTISNRIS